MSPPFTVKLPVSIDVFPILEHVPAQIVFVPVQLSFQGYQEVRFYIFHYASGSPSNVSEASSIDSPLCGCSSHFTSLFVPTKIDGFLASFIFILHVSPRL